MKKLIVLMITISAFQGFSAETKEADSAKAKQQAQAAVQAPKPTVQVVTVKPQDIVFSQDLPGRVSAFREAEVRARVDGIVEKRIFTEGSYVKEGEQLYQIEDRTLKANVRSAMADLEYAKSTYKLAKQTLVRYKKLLKQGAVSQQEYDEYNAQTQQGAAQVDQAAAELENAQITLEYSKVIAPISGRIDHSLVTEGALASAGTTKLATIEQINKVYIDFTRSTSQVADLRKAIMSSNEQEQHHDQAQPDVQIFFDDGERYPQMAKLSFSSMSVDETTGSIQLRAIVDNPDNLLLPGMYVRVKLPVSESDNAITIPQRAVNISADGASVFIVKDGKLAIRPVVVGKLSGENWLIKSGISVGDLVVVSAPSRSSIPGTPVNTEQVTMQSQNTKAN